MNPDDVVSKLWSRFKIWGVLKPILFYEGDTKDLIKGDGMG